MNVLMQKEVSIAFLEFGIIVLLPRRSSSLTDSVFGRLEVFAWESEPGLTEVFILDPEAASQTILANSVFCCFLLMS